MLDQREAFVVVRMLLAAERLGAGEVVEIMPGPELLVVDPMAPLDLP